MLEQHFLAVPDQAAAIAAGSAWLFGRPPEGRPYEVGADTSGIAIGGVTGQCSEVNGELRVLAYFSSHLHVCQQHRHPFEQDFWELLIIRRDAIKHLGRIPAVIQTDHANIARLEALPLDRVGSKHYRWLSELLKGGSLLLYRPGAGVLHRAPDGISRNPEGRDRLLLARSGEWRDQRARIRGVRKAIEHGDFDDEEPKLQDIGVQSIPDEALGSADLEESLLQQGYRQCSAAQGDAMGTAKLEESLYHLVQDEKTVESIFCDELPPDEYCERLGPVLQKKWPKADKQLVVHVVALVVALDTATAFALSFGIDKFALAQIEAKLVGEIVGRYGRRPNPEIVRAIRNWPPVETLKQLHEFLGT